MILPTPLEQAPEAVARGRELYFKREELHELGAFKWRGALPTVEAFREKGARGVVTASTGNHGAATAWAARRVGISAIVYVPRAASVAKLELIRRLGAEICIAGKDLDEAKASAERFAQGAKLPFFEDGAEPSQYAGYGQIAEEILDQLGREPAAVVVPLGNGALVGGVGQALRSRGAARTLLLAAAAREAPVMALSFRARRAVPCDRMNTFADGLAVRVAIPLAVESIGKVVDEVLLVSEREIANAIKDFALVGIRAEGAAAAALAALPRVPPVPGPIVVLVTGRNIDEELYARALTRPDSFHD